MLIENPVNIGHGNTQEHYQNRASSYAVLILLITAISLVPQSAYASKCLFISSYHQGYAWADGVELGIRFTLNNKCELRQFDMDTKRHKKQSFAKKKALEARNIIESWHPDIVIVADDNAVKYVLQKYYKDAAIPFVFCGVNWTADEYNFPYKNATGIIEVAPIRPLLDEVVSLLPRAKRALYIGANTGTETKNYERFEKATAQMSIHLDSVLADSVKQWLAAYKKAQQYDFVIIGSNAGIPGWERDAILSNITRVSKKLSITSHEWMMPYTMLGFTKIAEEQGELAARAALSILDGTDISSIAIVPNRKWEIWSNVSLLNASGIQPGDALMLKSKHVN
jgi:hypothetical protein